MPSAEAQQDPLGHLSEEEAALFARFLVLIRDNYTKADKAALFLERRAGVANTCSIANLRDVLSHLATLLDPNTTSERRAAQLASAEEHLRRAIIEPYEIALGELTAKFTPVYDGYREKVIPIHEMEGFRTAPPRSVIDGRLTEIDQLAEAGKHAKARNRWDMEWEAGVESLIDAYNKLSELHREIEEWVFKHNQYVFQVKTVNTSSHHTWLHRWGIAWAIIGLLVGSVVTYAVTKYVTPNAAVQTIDPAK